MARALDVIGDRWTLILIRELLLGPKRYGDLLAASPGIGTNLLADRLRQMEGQGLIARTTLPPPAGSTVYRLTEVGAGLETVVRAIGRWGANLMGPRRPEELLSPGAYFIALRERFLPERAVGLDEAYEFRVDGRVFWVRVEDQHCTTSEGEGGQGSPVAAFAMSVDTLNDIFLGTLSASDAIQGGKVGVTGDPEALARFEHMFSPPDA
ncbi:winged helix-turn-helix transcriptional regulator [Rhodoligotrophos ferricapiens]|uniref:winged helix-turn-helix transcriptional regulator n=1 Tax=Rhodoligotrophos ferricapiens TaxID=3069264 RepID=UPI00315CCD2D